MSARGQGKGERAEELLRTHFFGLGFYVARGVGFEFQGEDATDVDLWLYLRSSSLTRERINVDIKNRVTPKTVERIIWAKGLQAILGLDKCIVVTTGLAESLKVFGGLHGVQVLDRLFISRLKAAPESRQRLTQEQLGEACVDSIGTNTAKAWRNRLESAKTRLLLSLDFDGCNAWLEDCRFFMRECLNPARQSEGWRATYLCISYFLIGLDFTTQAIALEDREYRAARMFDGFRFGTQGRARLTSSLELAEQMLLASGAPTVDRGNFRKNVEAELGALRTDVLSEYFSRPESLRDLFTLAREFELASSAPAVFPPDLLSVGAQAVIGVLLDYHSIDRAQYFGVQRSKLRLPIHEKRPSGEGADSNRDLFDRGQ